jgi:hypothetical protein
MNVTRSVQNRIPDSPLTPQATIKKPNAATRFIRRVASAPNVKNLFNVPGNRTNPPHVPYGLTASTSPPDTPTSGKKDLPPTSPTTRNGLLAPATSLSSLLSPKRRSRSKSRSRRRGTRTSEDDSLDVDEMGATTSASSGLFSRSGGKSSASSSRRQSTTQATYNTSGTLVGYGVGGRKVRANSAAPSPTAAGSGAASASGTLSDGGLQVPKTPEEQRARFRRTYSSNSIKISSVCGLDCRY